MIDRRGNQLREVLVCVEVFGFSSLFFLKKSDACLSLKKSDATRIAFFKIQTMVPPCRIFSPGDYGIRTHHSKRLKIQTSHRTLNVIPGMHRNTGEK